MTEDQDSIHLLEFSVENYRSIREPITLSLFSTALHDKKHDFSISTNKRKVLNSLVLYGANASGKSNLLRALFVYKHAVTGSRSLFRNEKIDPFLLDESSKTRDTTFEACFEYENRTFIYGFKLSTKNSTVSKEWLRVTRKNSTSLLTIFERDNDQIEVSRNLPLSAHGISRGYSKLVQSQELFITTISRNSAWSLAKDVVNAWENCFVFNTLVHDPLQPVAETIYNSDEAKDLLLPLLQQADLSITDIRVTKSESDEYKIKLQHTYTNKNSVKSVWFDIQQQESAGTLKFFSFALPLLMSLRGGTLMVLDELGSTLHPDLLKFIVSLFNSSSSNKKHAQLILTTHDTSLLKGLLARDQIYFTRKNAHQSTELYPLSDIKGIKKGIRDLDERYLGGDFGAVPEIIRG